MNYMVPEQIRAEPVDHRADIFAGVLLYEPAEWPVRGRFVRGHHSAAGTAGTADDDCPEVPTAIVAIVDRAIEKDRDRRYRSMDEMLADLEEVRALLPPPAPIQLAEGEAEVSLGAGSRPPSGPTAGARNYARHAARPGDARWPRPVPRVLSSKMSPVKSTARPPGHVTARSETTPDSAPR